MQLTPRELAEKLVDVYLAWLQSADRDAGWHGQHIIGRLIDFKGDLPGTSGYMPDDGMIREVRFLRTPHALLNEAKALIGEMDRRQRDAVLLSVLCKRRVRIVKDVEVPMSLFHIADAAGVNPNTFRTRIKRGWEWLEKELENSHLLAA
ncbi:hypothetical protein [Marinobacter sp.]|uniref:hypothetical protein n=1 Tax=Marinobacter sp. TaxID=50741 RepID=UPI0035C76ADF